MTHDEIAILHLSDLHIEDITDDQQTLPDHLEKLLCDLSLQTMDILELIIVVTGDIITKANTSHNTHVTVIDFFEKLKNKISSKIIDVHIVPGNHDFVRSNAKENFEILECKSKSHTEVKGFDGYLTIVKKIYKIFGIERTAFTYYVEFTTIQNFSIAFIGINSTWYSKDDKDKRNLKIGDTQLKFLQTDLKNKKSKAKKDKKPCCLTITLSHHPLNWFESGDEVLLINSLMDKSFLSSDLFMCGHTHDSKTSVFHNHKHSLTTLLTGIGWNRGSPEDPINEFRYSMYKINVPHNACKIIMRKSDLNGNFDFNYDVYAHKKEKKYKHITLPLKANDSTTFLSLKTINYTNAKFDYTKKDCFFVNENSLHVNDDVFDMIPQIAFAMSDFRSSVTSILSIYKDDFLLDYLIIHGDTDIDDIEKFLLADDLTLSDDLNEKWTSTCNSDENFFDDNYFSMYLYDICEQLIFYLESVFPSNTLLRTHFRAYCGIDFEKKDDQFISIAHSSNINYNKKTSETTIPTPKLIPYYNSLICASFESGYNLIYSGNKKLNTKHPTDWQDFMTTIPNFQNHSKDMRFDRKHMNTLYKRPLITFGISFKNTSNLQLSMTTLAILDYLKINEYLSFFIDEYVRLFNFDIEMYLKKVVRKSYKETLNCEKRKNEDNFNGGSI